MSALRWLTIVILWFGTIGAAQDRSPFHPPDELKTWKSQRETTHRQLCELLGDLPPRSGPVPVKTATVEDREHYRLENVRFPNGAGADVPGVILIPKRERPTAGFPAIVYLHDHGQQGKGELFRPSPVGVSPADELTSRGYAVLCIDAYCAGERIDSAADETTLFKTFLSEGRTLWGMMLRDDLLSIDYLLSRREIDAKHVGVTGMGMGSSRAFWLMALDERLSCGVSVAGLTRFRDLIATGNQRELSLCSWVPGFSRAMDTEAVLALCAPRPLCTMSGDRDPAAPVAGVNRLNDVAKHVYGLYGVAWEYQRTVFGGQGRTYTPLEWEMMLEFFEKHFQPQGPTPLPAAPTPEPKPDSSWVDPASAGIAGWVAEMSQRAETWTWADGVIRCRPGENEYGWLRLPDELDDFVLTLEWNASPNGNSGVFLRSLPVPWSLPPSVESGLRVATLGLTWPSRTGLELQAADDHVGPNKYSTGSLYRHAAPASKPSFPAGEWNRYTVRCRGARVEAWLNGVQIHDTRLDTLPSLRRVPLRGYIGLQNHGVAADFRSIRYLRLTSATVPGGS